MPTNKDLLLEKITPVLQEAFRDYHFVLHKKVFFERIDKHGNINQYEILCPHRNGYFHFHLRLNLLNKQLEKQVNQVWKKVFRDPRLNSYEGWEPKKIEGFTKHRLRDYRVYDVTDWRWATRNGNESLEDFNKRFNIWFCVFNDIEEIDDWKGQLQESARMADKWFSSIGSEEWIIANTEFSSMYLLKKLNRIQELENKYKEILKMARLRQETELFYEYLKNEVII